MNNGNPPIGGKRMTQRDIAKAGGGSLRMMERAGFVVRNSIDEVVSSVRSGSLNLHLAEKIARLPRDQQADALQLALNPTPKKRPPWELQHDVDRLAAMINRLSYRWTDEDRWVMATILHELGRQLAGIEEPEIDDAGEEWGET